MSRNRKAHESVVAAILCATQLNGDDDELPGCPMCGSRSKAKTGECAACGTFVCHQCGDMHLGEVRPCPGQGVPIPRKGRR